MTAFFLALIPAFIASLPLFGSRFIPTHDGEYHIIRFWQFYTGLASGQWFPRWAPDLNNGLGIPLFTFNYPFPNYIGSFFHLFGLSFVDSFKWTMALGYLSAVIWCYLFVKKEFGVRAAVIATVIFSYVPYWFVDIYVRGSVGEVWALSFVMLALYALSYNRPRIFALSVGALILSHNILAMIFVPALFFIAIRTGRMFIYWITGIGLAAYFWLPALLERSYVVGLNTVSYKDHFPAVVQLLFPSWGSGYSVPGLDDQMSFQIGIIPLIVLVIAGVLVVRRTQMSASVRRYSVLALTVSVVSAFIMTEYAAPLWAAVPFIRFMQFPWRLLSVFVIATSVLAGLVAGKLPKWGIILALLSVLFAYPYTRPVTYEMRTDAQYLENPSFTTGTSSLGDMFNTRWFSGSPGQEFLFAGQAIASIKLTPTTYRVALEATETGTLVVPLAYYPGWRATIDGLDTTVIPNENGLVSLTVPGGTRDLRIWLGSTPWQRVAGLMSILSLSVLAVSFYPLSLYWVLLQINRKVLQFIFSKHGEV